MVGKIVAVQGLIAALSGWLWAGRLIAGWQYWLCGIPISILASWFLVAQLEDHCDVP